LLQTLVRKAVPTPTEALKVVDRSLIGVWGTQDEPAAQAGAQAGQGSRLQGSIFYRDAISTMAAPNSRACSLGISI